MPLTDFGLGFYTTTNLNQAKNWANMRCKVLSAKLPVPAVTPIASVLRFDVDRDPLSREEMLCFVTENSSSDFWDLVQRCRRNPPPGQHGRSTGNSYDVVFGPVTLWPQTLVIKDCDQVSFHTPKALGLLTRGAVHAQQNMGQPLFP